MADPDQGRNIQLMSRIAFILAFIAMLLGIVMYWPRPAAGTDVAAITRST
jgi:hypothetical protein